MNRQINNTLQFLKKGKTILYPTDTVWGIGCDATNEEAVSKIFEIKKRNEGKSLVVLVNGLEMLKNYVKNIPDKAIEILKASPKPTTIIYSNPTGLAKNIAKDNSVAIRVVQNEFCQQLIEAFGKPIVSTSANSSGLPTPKCFKEIQPLILKNVDYVVNLHRTKINYLPSTILKVYKNNTIKIIRE